MSPTTNEMRLPDTMTLERRATCTPGSDERPMLRTADGHVLAVVEQWQPETGTSIRDQN